MGGQRQAAASFKIIRPRSIFTYSLYKIILVRYNCIANCHLCNSELNLSNSVSELPVMLVIFYSKVVFILKYPAKRRKNVAKQSWSKPELIILMRNHPSETVVLKGCKHPGTSGPGNTSQPPACSDNTGSGSQQCFSSSGGQS